MPILETSLPMSGHAMWLRPSEWPPASAHLFTPGPFTLGEPPQLITNYSAVREALLNRYGLWSRHVPEGVIPRDERHCTLSASWGEDGGEHRSLRGSLSRINSGSNGAARGFTRERTRELLGQLMAEEQPWDLARVIYQVSMELVIRHTLEAPPLLPFAHKLRMLTREHVANPGGFFAIKRQPEAEDILRVVLRRREQLEPGGLAAHLVDLLDQGRLTMEQFLGQLWLICVSQETQATATASLMGMLFEYNEFDYARSIVGDYDAMMLLVKEAGRRAIVFPASLVIATEEVAIDEQLIKPGTVCLVSYAAANLDPAWFSNPLLFDPRAQRDTPHIAFGQGAHRCQGEHSAEEFMEDVTSVLVTELPRYAQLANGSLLREVGISMAVSRLPIAA